MRQDRPKLGAKVVAELGAEIRAGRPAPGARLPTEPELVARFGVSRTVIREAIAELRADGLVDSRQGAGVFVREGPGTAAVAGRISEVVEELELRAAVEIEAAGLAAERASPAQEVEIGERFRDFAALVRQGEPTAEADYALHLAIARATNNPRFEGFLAQLGGRTIPRAQLRGVVEPPERAAALEAEHRALTDAILSHDAAAARAAMRAHLLGALSRYRAMARAAARAET